MNSLIQKILPYRIFCIGGLDQNNRMINGVSKEQMQSFMKNNQYFRYSTSSSLTWEKTTLDGVSCYRNTGTGDFSLESPSGSANIVDRSMNLAFYRLKKKQSDITDITSTSTTEFSTRAAWYIDGVNSKQLYQLGYEQNIKDNWIDICKIMDHNHATTYKKILTFYSSDISPTGAVDISMNSVPSTFNGSTTTQQVSGTGANYYLTYAPTISFSTTNFYLSHYEVFHMPYDILPIEDIDLSTLQELLFSSHIITITR